jgi:hypothetical protein
MMYVTTKEELSDRNKQLQRDKGYPNIPKGAKVLVYQFADGSLGKFSTVTWNNQRYVVRTSDLNLPDGTGVW